jgi:hypothetical protein
MAHVLGGRAVFLGRDGDETLGEWAVGLTPERGRWDWLVDDNGARFDSISGAVEWEDTIRLRSDPDWRVEDYGPPRDVRDGHRLTYSLSPTIGPPYRESMSGTAEVNLPDPVWRGSSLGKGNVYYYGQFPIGIVTDVLTGEILDPAELVPDDVLEEPEFRLVGGTVEEVRRRIDEDGPEP